ncbi:LacI family DNA-binding transcriptional regulator [Nocardiopsis sp. CNS-639]|uniref:LacI family DNA-binding transcriptional regulator n=1 Tax=Nocardiopsis sp. CNS-639 TaxID=1169153 RepID=UPI00036249AE|nr:LacI family DNA-binding transcriptional regulator [Nocardiopsis sp. CNS-639]
MAREAGVSQTTVSYVLNNVPHQKISAATRQRILTAVEKLGYRPSVAARTLRTGRSDTVLLLLADMPLGHTAIELIERLTQVLQRHGLNVVTRIDDESSDGSLWADLVPRTVVVLAPVSSERRERMESAGIQVINAWRREPGETGHDALGRSQNRVGRLQAHHLVSAGHRRIGYAAPLDTRLSAFHELRSQGVEDVCAELGLEQPVVRAVEADAGAAAAAVRAWRSEGVTGVCAFNDEMAFALLAGMRGEGWTAPVDLAVIGVDDIPVARFAEPPLTTVDQHMETVAGELAQAVLRPRDSLADIHRLRGESATVVVRSSA